MTVQRVVFHYGIELAGLKYNGDELGALRRRLGTGAKVELTFDPGDLGHINVLDPKDGTYVRVSALDHDYAKGLSLWQHRVIRRYAQRQLNARTNIVALAQAKAEIHALVERDFYRKSTYGRKRHARFLEDHTDGTGPDVTLQPACEGNLHHSETRPVLAADTGQCKQVKTEARPWPDPATAPPDAFTDDEVLPVFEASVDSPYVPIQDNETPETEQIE
jgi:Mu transposase, C-terminal